jgi:hypothetical protein
MVERSEMHLSVWVGWVVVRVEEKVHKNSILEVTLSFMALYACHTNIHMIFFKIEFNNLDKVTNTY